jgi:hypothetical protein
MQCGTYCIIQAQAQHLRYGFPRPGAPVLILYVMGRGPWIVVSSIISYTRNTYHNTYIHYITRSLISTTRAANLLCAIRHGMRLETNHKPSFGLHRTCQNKGLFIPRAGNTSRRHYRARVHQGSSRLRQSADIINETVVVS